MQKSNGELVPGGLAMVIGATNCRANIGAMVELDHFVKRGELAPSGNPVIVDAWICFSDLLICRGGKFVKDGYSIHRPEHLMPINPEADPLHVSEREKCTND